MPIATFLLLALAQPADAGGLGTAMRALKVGVVAGRAVQTYGRLQDGTVALTMTELRTCIATERSVAALEPTFAPREAALKASEADILKRVASLEALERKMDPSDEVAVARYNARARAGRTALKKHNDTLAAFDVEIERFNGMVDTFNRNCSGKSYYESDHTRAVQSLALGGQ